MRPQWKSRRDLEQSFSNVNKHKITKELCLNVYSNSLCLGLNLKFCILDKLLGYAHATASLTHPPLRNKGIK